ncbi:N-acetylmuramoyl-L-alanine amidase [Flavobacterium oreochromis]|uniref:N-acetylmuramoyl-L-alanine amidase n=1 Tax=Flavobacterium columnare TaxID=996 RepID=A0A246G9U7_9FLAO|nr:N-acetylmuramoyl-L-alanine amidase [Flavobacterium oreochromis]OWP76536.1 N-acetylmuramoyl-L-alanine amidase [Flavobacterium oreochromis]
MREVTHIVIHCTGAPQTQTIECIKSFWKYVKGWKNVGYHKVIEANGKVTELATPDKVTNGVAGNNSKSYHICYLGGQNGVDNRTQEQKKALLIEVKNAKKLFPKAVVLGHRDFSPDLNGDGIINPSEWTKKCPSFNAKNEYKNV